MAGKPWLRRDEAWLRLSSIEDLSTGCWEWKKSKIWNGMVLINQRYQGSNLEKILQERGICSEW